jgi:hypothetical protein
VTPDGARRDYGCVVGADGRIDIAESQRLRQKSAEFEPAK